ncbi:MAG: cytochrome c maturation protein CcmE [Acidobacteriaceae bacterium]
MTKQKSNPIAKFIIAGAIVVGTVAWLSISAAGNAKSYYVTIGELQSMGNKAYKENLRVAGNVQPGSITRFGPNANFTLVEKVNNKEELLRVKYEGAEPPPDEFKDDAQTLAVGTYGRDGTFHASQLQAKCASKYAPAKNGVAPTGNLAALAPKS